MLIFTDAKLKFAANLHMPKLLPVKLKKEPLVEAACQLRVTGEAALNTFFPGLLLAQHKDDVSEIQQLPAAMIPGLVRAMQPEMAFAALVKLKFKGVLVMIGERSITVSNPAPYLGWAGFKPLIVQVFTVLLNSNLVNRVERYSLKYINVLKVSETLDPLSALAWSLSVGGLELDKRATTIRTQTSTDEVLSVVTISGGVTVQAEGQAPVQGSLIDIDTICQNKPQDAKSFAESMLTELDRVRRINKEAFFECLTKEAIDELEPIYE